MYYMRANKPLPSLELLKETFEYNSKTGELIRKKNGRVCNTRSTKGYFVVKCKGPMYQVSRICYYLHTGVEPGALFIDHIDQDPTNNRIDNLRLADNALNQSNIRQQKGYTYEDNPRRRKSPWHMTLMHKGRRVVSKYYSCPLLARLAYVEAVRTYKGLIIPV